MNCFSLKLFCVWPTSEGTAQRIQAEQHEHTFKRGPTKHATLGNQTECCEVKIPKTVSHIPLQDFLQPELVPRQPHICPGSAWLRGAPEHPAHQGAAGICYKHTCIYSPAHWVLFSLPFCYTKFLCRTMFQLIEDWTLSWQVGRKLKIILSPGFKRSERWHARAPQATVCLDQGSAESALLQSHRRGRGIHLLDMLPSREFMGGEGRKRQREKLPPWRETATNIWLMFLSIMITPKKGFSETPHLPPLPALCLNN